MKLREYTYHIALEYSLPDQPPAAHRIREGELFAFLGTNRKDYVIVYNLSNGTWGSANIITKKKLFRRSKEIL